MVQTIKFSQFVTATPNNSTNRLVGFANGMNIQQSIPVEWTTATRPTTPYDGLLGYNLTLDSYEFWSVSADQWLQLITSSETGGTVNPGLAGQITYYATSGDAVSGLISANSSILASDISGNPYWTQLFPALVQIQVGSFDGGAGAGISTFLRGDGTWSVPPGMGSVMPGLTNQLAHYASDGSVVSGLATAADSILVTDSGGAPSLSSSLPVAVQSNIDTVGIITVGTWQGSVVGSTYGGTGVNNGSSTITLGGSTIFSGSFTSQFNFTANSNVTFPNSGTLANTADLNAYVPLTGATMTGLLILSGNAVSSLGATTLQQVESLVATVSITGTTDQIFVGGTSPNFTLSFPSVLHTVNGTVLDDGSGNMTIHANLTVSGLTASMPVLTNASKQLVSGLIDLSTDVTNVLTLVNGGTGLSTVGIYSILMGNNGGTGYVDISTPSTAQVLVTSDFAGNEPQWAGALPFGVQNNITEVGTLTAGVWHATVIAGTYGGTGVNNGASTITVGGNFQMSGAFTFMGNLSANTNVTYPTSGTLVTTAGLGAYLPLAGGTMTGPLILSGDATTSLQAVTFEQLQAVASGFNIKDACYASTTANLTGYTYNNGSSGIGATLTAPTVGTFTTDGTTPPVTSRILVQFQSTPSQNGIYNLTTSSSIAAAVLTRSTDYDTSAQIFPGNLIIVDNGALYAGTGWLQTATVNTIGTDAINFSPFNLINAGTGLTRTGNTISLTNPVALNLGGTNAALTAANGGILYSNASSIQILAPTVTANQMLQSGASTTPSWSTTTWPATTAINTILYSSSANVIAALTTGNNGVLITSGTGVPSISSTLPFAVQGNITTVGTISSGTWNGGVIGAAFGGTGVNNGSSVIIIGGSHTLSGAFTSTFTFTANTSVIFPSSGTLATVGGTISSILGTMNQITANTVSTVTTLSFPSVLETTNGNVLDDGSKGCTFGSSGSSSMVFGNGASPSTFDMRGTFEWGQGDPASSCSFNIGAYTSITTTKTINIGNNTSTPSTTNILGTLNINTAGGTGQTSIGGNGINITANSTGAVTIGNALNTISLGSQGSASSVVNIQPGTGNNQTNICATAGYSGTLTIGNSSATLDINTTKTNFAAGHTLALQSSGTFSIGDTTNTSTLNVQTTTSGTINVGVNLVGGTLNLGHINTNAVGGIGGVVNIEGGLVFGFPTAYSTGTASTSGASNTVTGSGTSWNINMVNGIIMVTSGTNIGAQVGITAVGSTTSLTTDAPITIASGSSYIIYFLSHQISSRSVALCTSGNQTSFTVGTNTYSGPITLGNTNLNAGTISLLTTSSGKVVTANNTLDGGSGTASFAGLTTMTSGFTANSFSQINGASTQADVFQIASTGASNNAVQMFLQSQSTSRMGIIWDSVNGLQIRDSNNSTTWLSQASTTAGSIKTLNNTLDNGSGTATFAGLVTGNAGLTVVGVINLNNTTSGSNINIGASSSYTGDVSIGGNAIAITANSTGAVTIGNSLNSIFIGSSGSANSIVNIQPGTGNGAVTIGSSGYTGTISIGSSTSTTAFNGNVNFTNGTTSAFTFTNTSASMAYPDSVVLIQGPDVSNTPTLTLSRSGTTVDKRLMILMQPSGSNGFEINTDTGNNGTLDFGIYSEANTKYGFKITQFGQFQSGTVPFFTTSPPTASSSLTMTASELITNGIIQAPTGISGNFNWTFDTGANIYSAMGSPAVGTTAQVKIINNQGVGTGAFTASTGVSLFISSNVPPNSSTIIYIRVTGTNTVTVYN